MAVSPEQAQWFSDTFHQITANIGQALLGKEDVIALTLTCLLTEGHILLEDAPGTGKTALARALAASIEADHSRIQFTPDLLPSDITGVTIFDQKTGDWKFHQGPIFSSIVLADEINRASPKTQSALLEVMEESQVTVDGVRYETGSPFMVIATQNPIEQAGTYKLPEAQLDRFLMKISIGYPNRESAIQILLGSAHPDRSAQLAPIISAGLISDMAVMASDNYTEEQLCAYIQDLADATRQNPSVRIGVSTRAAIAMTRAVRVWAMSQGRHYATADDVRDLAQHVWGHRIILDPDAEFAGVTTEQVIASVLQTVPAPHIA